MGTSKVLVAAALLSVITACGGGGAEVLVKGFRFQPDQIEVATGDAVIWRQQDNTTHTITAGKPSEQSGLFDHEVGKGEEFSFTFDEAGSFSYFCRIHPEGMRGTVEVG